MKFDIYKYEKNFIEKLILYIMESLKNYINEGLSEDTIKKLEDIFSDLKKEATDKNWDILLKQKLSDVVGYMTEIKTYLGGKGIEKYFDDFKKCLKKSQDINNKKLTRELFVDYIKGNKLKLEDLITNKPISQGDIYEVINKRFSFSPSYLKDIYNISGQDKKALGVGKGEILLICFLEGAMKGKAGDVQIGNDILIEVKGNRARIPFKDDWFEKFLSRVTNFNRISQNPLKNKTVFKQWFNEGRNWESFKNRLIKCIENKENLIMGYFENWAKFDLKILNDSKDLTDNIWRLIAALSLMHYDADWNYFYIMNERGYYKILERSNNVKDYYDFLEGIKLEAGLVKGAQSHKGFQFTLL